jgi:hypothetical protein
VRLHCERQLVPFVCVSDLCFLWVRAGTWERRRTCSVCCFTGFQNWCITTTTVREVTARSSPKQSRIWPSTKTPHDTSYSTHAPVLGITFCHPQRMYDHESLIPRFHSKLSNNLDDTRIFVTCTHPPPSKKCTNNRFLHPVLDGHVNLQRNHPDKALFHVLQAVTHCISPVDASSSVVDDLTPHASKPQKHSVRTRTRSLPQCVSTLRPARVFTNETQPTGL